MKKMVLLMVPILFLFGCMNAGSSRNRTVTATPHDITSFPTENDSTWNIYHSDPNHIWNRVFRQFFERLSISGEVYGSDELDPLLWFDTTYLLTGESHQRAIGVLDEFLDTHAENLIHDPLKRAMFQRDLWAVFDWSASQTEPYPAERLALQSRLAQVIRRVSLSKAEILSLPDTYALELDANTFPATVPPDHLETAFLPADLLQPDSAWVPMGREGGPVAMTHTEAFPFFGRSVFQVFVRSPNGRAATLDFIHSLNQKQTPPTAIGSDVALLRRMILIDDQGDLVLSPVVETLQLRHFSPAQKFHEFELSRVRLLDGVGGGLVLKTDLFMLFMSHGDPFENSIPELKVKIPEICKACHFENPSILDSGNTRSIISYSRQPFSLPDNSTPKLFATTLDEEAQTVIRWKYKHPTWEALEKMWAAHP